MLMAGTQNGPIPTQLTFLSDLGKYGPGSKVRFLGCVMEYRMKHADLVLQHNYPPGNSLRAHVDVSLLVSSMRSHETRIGEWVNVMGYIKGGKDVKDVTVGALEHHVQAIVLWSAGSLELQGYEKTLSPRSESNRTA